MTNKLLAGIIVSVSVIELNCNKCCSSCKKNPVGTSNSSVGGKFEIDEDVQLNDGGLNLDEKDKELLGQMSAIFKSEFIEELLKAKRLLKKLGICEALDKIITPDVIFIPYFVRNKTFELHNRPVKIYKKKKDFKIGPSNSLFNLANNEEDGAKNLKKEFVFPSGAIFIEKTYFKYLRCSGCSDDKCVSCKLKKYLDSRGLYDKFVDIYLNQGNSSAYSKALKKIIHDGLSDPVKNKIVSDNLYYCSDFTSTVVDDEIRKCFFIEWALTIEFLTRFIKIIPKEYVQCLYRVVDIVDSSITRISPFESTSIFGTQFITQYKSKNWKCFKTSNLDIWRCIFCYAISPDKYSMFYPRSDKEGRKYLESFDYELEVGYIPIESGYEFCSSIDDAHAKYEKDCNDYFNNVTKTKISSNGELLLHFPDKLTTLVED